MNQGGASTFVARRMSMLAATVATIALAGCGGGSESGSAATPAPATGAAAGDYYTFQNVTTGTVPAGTTPTTSHSTLTFASVASDGSSVRVSTNSSPLAIAVRRNQTASGAWTSQDTWANGIASATCSFSPAVQFTPTTPRSVGQNWNQTWTQTCGASTNTGSHTGTIQALEDSVIALGTFPSYRTVRTATITNSINVTVMTETCWYSTTLIANVRCVTDSTVTPVGSSTPSSVSSTDSRLVAYGGPAKTPTGNVVARFAGRWQVAYAGGVVSTCNNVLITPTGAVTGTCPAAGGGSFTVTGTVNASGALTASLSSGGTLTGSLTTPYSGSGTWVDSGTNGTWTATHN